jgi:hypothetical protein
MRKNKGCEFWEEMDIMKTCLKGLKKDSGLVQFIPMSWPRQTKRSCYRLTWNPRCWRVSQHREGLPNHSPLQWVPELHLASPTNSSASKSPIKGRGQKRPTPSHHKRRVSRHLAEERIVSPGSSPRSTRHQHETKPMGCLFRRLHQTPPSQRPLLGFPELLGSDSDLLPELKFQGGWVSVGRWVWSCDPSSGFGLTIKISMQAWQSINDGFRLVGWRFPVRKIPRRFWTSKDERTSAFEL